MVLMKRVLVFSNYNGSKRNIIYKYASRDFGMSDLQYTHSKRYNKS